MSNITTSQLCLLDVSAYAERSDVNFWDLDREPVDPLWEKLQAGIIAKKEKLQAGIIDHAEIPACKNKNTRLQKRIKGAGTGWIEQRRVYRGNRSYLQYFFHWEVWSDGRVEGRSRYVRKAKVDAIVALNESLAPVDEILAALA